VAIYARVSSPEHRDHLQRQATRRADSCAARGYQVAQLVKAIASGVTDRRPKRLALLTDTRVTRIVVEHRDRPTHFELHSLTCCELHSLEVLLQAQGRLIEVMNLAENDNEDVMADLVASVYSCTARLYAQQRAKRTTERIAADVRGEGEGADADAPR
jgi:putative resolvase